MGYSSSMIPRANLKEVSLYQASKWLTLPLFITPLEMQEALALLPKKIVPLSGVIEEKDEVLSQKDFLDLYTSYYEQLAIGIKRPQISPLLTAAFSTTLEAFQAVKVEKGLLIRIKSPCIQVQPYRLHYSETAHKFVDTTHSMESFAFGLVFSIPQIYQNPETHAIEKVAIPEFKALQKWAREHTIPTPFQVGDEVMNFPARISKTKSCPVSLPKK